MLSIEARWEGTPSCFGSPYICAIGDTVTGGEARGSPPLPPAISRSPTCCRSRPPTPRLSPPCCPNAAGEKGTEGSLEYLVYSNVLVQLAAQVGLRPVLDYGDAQLAALFEKVRAGAGAVMGEQLESRSLLQRSY